jgi:carbonic anhydrase/acetyltransferase-like protein (isoleucine patch superfamily)
MSLKKYGGQSLKPMIVTEFVRKWRFWLTADRLGPDMPLTQIRLYAPSSMRKLCEKMFQKFGDGAEFRPGAYAICCSKISIGNRVVIRPGTMLFADPRENGMGIIVEDDVLIGSGVHLYCANHRYDNPDMPIIDQGHYASKQIVLKRGCWIGANAIILSGVTIGYNAVIGAGSVVTRDIPDRVVAAGNPARIIREISQQSISKGRTFK